MTAPGPLLDARPAVYEERLANPAAMCSAGQQPGLGIEDGG